MLNHRRLRVLLASPSLDLEGGVANYARLLLEHLDPAVVSVRHVAVGRSATDSPTWFRPVEYAASLWRFVVALLHTHPDVVHINPSLSWQSLPINLVLLAIVKLIAGRPVLVFFRGWYENVATSLCNNRSMGILRTWLSWADIYLVLAEKFRCRLIEAGLQPDRIVVSAVMTDTELLCSSGRETQDQDQDSKVFQVLFLSRLSRDKGVWEMVEAIDWWQRRYSDLPVVFTVAGAGPEMESLSARLQTKIRSGTVNLPGYVCGLEKWKLLQGADLFVFPSYHEGFPNVIVEALAAGLPIVYTPVGALSEVLAPTNGIRIDLADLSGEAIGEAIWDLYRDSARRRTIAMANRKLAQERYDVKTVCAQMVEIYRHVAGA